MRDRTVAEDWFISVVSGRRRGPVAGAARAVLSAMEPVYKAAVMARNMGYSRRVIIPKHTTRPVVSIGNLTTGGTGKTPIVAWMADKLREAGRKPAVLLRGYKADPDGSDEEKLLRRLLGSGESAVPVRAGANRYDTSLALLKEEPTVDVFVLDDGLQHRQLARHIDLALVDATNPFGYGHVLPRGLLREPIRAVRRLHGVVITRTDQVDAATITSIENSVRAEQREISIFHCDLVQDRVIDEAEVAQPIDALRGKRFYAFCGIANPDNFFRQLDGAGGTCVGQRRFADHHAYSAAQLLEIFRAAKESNAETIITTEKDWTKVGPLLQQLKSAIADRLPISRVAISVRFAGDEGERLFQQTLAAVVQGDGLLGWRANGG